MGRCKAVKGITSVSHAHRLPTYLLYQSQKGPHLYNMGGRQSWSLALEPLFLVYPSGLIWLKVTEIQLTLEKMIPHCFL